MDKVTRSVLQYANSQTIPILYTWQGVNSAILNARLMSQRQKREAAENAVEDFVDAFDDELERYKRQIDDLTNANISPQMENQRLRAKLSGAESIPIIYLGEEEEFYPGEIKDMVLDSVYDALKRLPDKTRRTDVLKDILMNNGYQKFREDKEKQIKNMFIGYKTMPPTLRQDLISLGFDVTEDGKHYKLIYYGDDRYKNTIAKTGSDWREGKNIAARILTDMMWTSDGALI